LDAPGHRAQCIDLLNYDQYLVFFLVIILVVLVIGVLREQ
jgi:hypothetical protein